MDIADAIWHMEGGINYKNRFIPFTYEDVIEIEEQFDYPWAAGDHFTSNQMKDMMDAVQGRIDALPSDRKFIATDFYVAELSTSNIRVGVVITTAVPGGNPPFNITGYDAKANYGEKCNSLLPETAAMAQVTSKAFKKYLNGLAPFNQVIYSFYTSTRTFGSTGGRHYMSSNKLYGQNGALYTGHRAQPANNVYMNPSNCITGAEIEGYRDQVLTDVTNLGSKIYVIQLKADIFPAGTANNFGVRWNYSNVKVSAENFSVLQPQI